MNGRLMLAVTSFALCLLAGVAQAAPLTVTLVRTTALFNEDPPGAPLPLGRTQYDAGDVIAVTGAKIGEYLRVKDIHGGGLNVAAVTITLFLGQGDPPFPLTLQGVHSFNNADEIGSVSATGAGILGGVPFKLDGATNTLTIQFP